MKNMAKIYLDAASKGNPGLSAYGITIVEDGYRKTYSGALGEMDNHSAEWETLLLALEKAKALNVQNALIHTDSKLIEEAIQRGFIRNPKFKGYLEKYQKLAEEAFVICFVKWIPRSQNKEANALAQQTLYQLTKE